MKDEKKLLGKKIKEIRTRLYVTQEAFAETIGIETSSLSNIETGKSYPSMQTLLNIMNKFDVKPQEIFDFEYLKDNKNIEEEMIDIIKNQPYDKKQIMYRIIKQFAV